MFGGGYPEGQGASQFAGGGFMASPAPEGGMGGGSAMKKSSDSQNATLRAVTVKQLHEATQTTTEDSWYVDGHQLHNITLVGKLRSREDQATQLLLGLDDGTGTGMCSMWSEEDSGLVAHQQVEWQVGTYVRVYGHLRSMNNQLRIHCFNIKPILDFNEVTYHLMQCVFQHVYYTKGAQGASGATAAPAAPKAEAGTGNTANGGSGLAAGVHGVQADVLNAIKSPQFANRDASVDDVINLLSGKCSPHHIRQALGHLVDEGYLYTTSDEHHYKAADC